MADKQYRIPSGNVLLNVRQWSMNLSPTVVLVHGYPDNSRVWDKVATGLAKDFHVVAYDVRGAGLSEAPPGKQDYHLALLSDDLKAVIDHVSPNLPVHLVGHDWGSIQSWESVTRPVLEHRIASFTSISGPCLDHIGFWMRDRMTSRNTLGWSQISRQLANSWYIGMFHVPMLAPWVWRLGLGKAWPALLEKSDGVSEQPNPTQMEDGIAGIQLYRANMMSCLFRPRERYSNVPVQLLIPDRDPFISTALFEDIQRWVPNLWQKKLHASHWVPLSDPKRIAAHIREFVEFNGNVTEQTPPDQAAIDCA